MEILKCESCGKIAQYKCAVDGKTGGKQRLGIPGRDDLVSVYELTHE